MLQIPCASAPPPQSSRLPSRSPTHQCRDRDCTAPPLLPHIAVRQLLHATVKPYLIEFAPNQHLSQSQSFAIASPAKVTNVAFGDRVIYVGLFLSILVGALYLSGGFRPRPRYRFSSIPAPTASDFGQAIATLTQSWRAEADPFAFWIEAEAIQSARLHAIEQARHEIVFETFMMTPGQRAERFAQTIADRACAGVRVQLLLDRRGTHTMPASYWQSLQQAGVEIQFFNPFSWRSPLDYLNRTHRKLLVVDRETLLVGGAGISDDWDGDEHPWLDFEVGWRGQIAAIAADIFANHWLRAGGTLNWSKQLPHPSPQTQSTAVIIPSRNPTYYDSPIRDLFHLAVAAARHRIWISSPYLLPTDITLNALGAARDRGIDVRILTMGPHCDKPWVYFTSRDRYGALLDRDLAIYEYQPSMMHAKAILLDRAWVSFGSANLDPRSFFHNDELNLGSAHPHLAKQLESFFDRGFAASQRVTKTNWQSRSMHQKIAGKLGAIAYWQL